MKRIKNYALSLGQKIGAMKVAPSSSQIQTMLFLLGVALLTGGIMSSASAVDLTTSGANFNDTRISEAVDIILVFLQGSFGALVMVCAGIGAILSSAFGQYRAALGLLVVAVGAFILRSLVSTFFNDDSLQANTLRGDQ
jgi:hypothetical protein